MTLATIITTADLSDLLDGAFQQEVPVVTSSESDLGEPLQHFATPAEILAKAAACAEAGMHNYAFGFWYPSMKGHVVERKVTLDPPREGKTFRYSLTGWGIIHLHLYFTPPKTLQCRIAVNSEGRAISRQDRYPDLGPASEWDWRVVESYAFRLSRRLASIGRAVPVIQQSTSVAQKSPPAAPRSPWKRT